MIKKKLTQFEEDKLNIYRSKLIEAQKELQENSENEISETSLNRMNGPIGVELGEEEIKAMKIDNISKNILEKKLV
ncbi:MAG: hypothetical protein H0W50_05795 [Parachlamydiaceae bacterium]|nr:hypothetical protein [Parachlamydiaceae bacterium]